MSRDERLRQVARSQEGSSTARSLVERLRCGQLEVSHLRLAAHLGDPGALEALSLEEIPTEGNHITHSGNDIGMLVGRMSTFILGGEPRERARIAILREQIRLAERLWGVQSSMVGEFVSLAVPDDAPVDAIRSLEARRRGVEVLELAIACPCEAHARVAGHVDLHADLLPSWSDLCHFFPIHLRTGAFGSPMTSEAADSHIRDLLRKSLVPWALGTGDSISTQPVLRPPRIDDTKEWISRGWEGLPNAHEILTREEFEAARNGDLKACASLDLEFRRAGTWCPSRCPLPVQSRRPDCPV